MEFFFLLFFFVCQKGSNFTVHFLHTGMPVTSLLEARNLTIFKKLIELNGYDEKFDSFENVSIFAPTDLAFSNNYWAKKIDTEPEQLKGNEELTAFLKYHIAKPLTKTCDLSERTLDTELGKSVRINLYSTVSFSNKFTQKLFYFYLCSKLINNFLNVIFFQQI